MPKPLRLATPNTVRQVTVIEVTATRGEGVESDPVRVITQYWSPEGALLAEKDPTDG